MSVQPVSSSQSVQAFAPYPNFFVKQSRKGCIQTMLGCDAKVELSLATIEKQDTDVFFIQEGLHPFEMNLSQGAQPGGPLVSNHKRYCGTHVHQCKCCCYQTMETFDATGTSIGMAKEQFWFFVPGFNINKPDGTTEYVIHMPTCCMGLCVDMCAEGCCNCRIPFYIFTPGTDGQKGSEVGKFVKVWGSLGKEIMAMNRYELVFPPTADAQSKARIVGAALLLNELFFGRDAGQQ